MKNEEKIDNEMRISPAALSALMNGDIKNALIAATPGGIESQEAAGQQELVKSEMFPKQCPKEQLEKLGFVFGEDVDDLFVNVTMPKGWKKVATEHAMGSNLVDDKDRVRGSIFYKAAFYDRKADMHLIRRFRASCEPEDAYKSNMGYEARGKAPWFGRVYDQEEVVFETAPHIFGGTKEKWDKEQSLKEEALEWLNKKYPEWEDELSYWD